MEKDNSKVPIAILSCFLIAFILQGILKKSGVFVFEKALDWEIFRIIDNHKWLQIIYYGLINCIAMYCLSFALTTKPYSRKFYHYLVLLIVSMSITACRILISTPIFMEHIYDYCMYILTPIFINLTTDKNNLFSKTKNYNYIVFIISIQILLYLCYLGLCYWSSTLNSIIIIQQIYVYASSSFLIQFEVYTGLVLLMLSLNYAINKMN